MKKNEQQDNSKKHNKILNKAKNELFNASFQGDLERLQVLIETEGISCNFVNKVTSYTPVMVAAISGHKHIVDYLLANGATSKNWTLPVVPENEYCYTILEYFVIKQDLECLKKFMKIGKGIHPPLYIAVELNHREIAEWIIKKYPLSVHDQDRWRFPLEAAVLNWHTDMTRLLLEHGANPNIQPGYSFSLFHQAIVDGRGEIVQLMIKHGASLTFRPHELMLFAMGSGDLVTIEALLSNDVPVTCEHFRLALEQRQLKLIQLIFQYTDISIIHETLNKQSALHYFIEISSTYQSYHGI